MNIQDDSSLSVHEELLLLVLDDDSGAGGSDLGLGGGVLAELALRGAVEIEPDGKKSFVRAAATSLPGRDDELLAECLTDIVQSSKRRDAGHWVSKFAGKKNLKARVARRLVAAGVLDERRRKILFIELTKYPESNPLPEAELTERLRTAVEYDHITPDDRTTAVVSIANAAGLLTNNLDKKMLRARKDRLKELSESDGIGHAVKAAVEAITAAIVIGVAAGAAASS